MIPYLAEFFKEGGPFMFVNLIVLAVAVAIIVERTISLGFKLNLNARPFMEQVQKLVAAGDLTKAIRLTEAAPHASLAKVIRAGLAAANRGGEAVARSVEEEVLEETPNVTRRIASLWSLANVATLVGLIGTITGLIGTFRSLGAATPEMKQMMLSRGISEAMNNTAFGLIIAVLCIVGHLMLSSKAKAMVEELEVNGLKIENMLVRRGAGETNPLDVAARRA
jgi:biopolymer transport protein ExbB/TolQ